MDSLDLFLACCTLEFDSLMEIKCYKSHIRILECIIIDLSYILSDVTI